MFNPFSFQWLYFLCVTCVIGHYLSWGSACLNYSKSRSIYAFKQLRQIHFYVASLLPGTTICSHCRFCILSCLLLLLLEMMRHPEDLTSWLRQSHISFPRRWQFMDKKYTFYSSDLINGTVYVVTTHSRTQTIIQLHLKKLDLAFVLRLQVGFKCPRELFQLFRILLDGTKQ